LRIGVFKKQGRRQEAGGRGQKGRGFGLFFPFIAGGAAPLGRLSRKKAIGNQSVFA